MRGFLRFLVGLVVLLAIVWLGVWWYAEGRMRDGITRWADNIAAHGGQVSYDSIKRGTSPLTAAITLTNLNITSPSVGHGPVSFILPGVGLRIGLFNPLLLRVDLPNRITIGVNGTATVLAFQKIAAAERLDPHVLTGREDDPLRGGTLSASGVDLLASSGSLLVLHIDGVRSDYAYNHAAGAGAQALGVHADITGLALSPLLTHLLSIPFDGRVAHFGYGLNLSGPVPAALPGAARQLQSLPADDIAGRQKLLVPIVRQWAAAGGSGDVTLATTIGPSTATLAGNVKFDAKVQPEGTADVKADHLDAFTAALQNAYPELQAYVAQLEATLSPYLSSTPAGGQMLTLHAVYGGGTVTVNGKPAGTMPPLDWDALQNPAPTPAAPASN